MSSRKNTFITINLPIGTVSAQLEYHTKPIKMVLLKDEYGNELSNNDRITIYVPSYTTISDSLSELNDKFIKAKKEKNKEKLYRLPKYPEYKISSFEDLANDELHQNIDKNGRVSVYLSNGSSITVCKPALGFNNKGLDFINSRIEVERQYWIKQSNNTNNKDMAVIAKFMIFRFFRSNTHVSS